MRRFFYTLAILLILASVFSTESKCQFYENLYPTGTIDKLSNTEIKGLLDILNSSQLSGGSTTWATDFREKFFDDIHTPDLADLVIYINQPDDTVRQSLTKGGKEVSRNLLKGERDIYVLVIISTTNGLSIDSQWTSNPFCAPTGSANTQQAPPSSSSKRASSQTPKIVINHGALVQIRDPLLSRALGALGAVFGGVEVSDKAEEPPKESSTAVPLINLGKSTDNITELYLGFLKIPIAVGAWNRVTVCGGEATGLTDSTNVVVYNFGNTTHNKLRIGVSVGASLGHNNPANEPILDAIRGNFYIYATVYPWKAAPPKRLDLSSFGVALGTKIVKENPFNDNFVAISLRDLFAGNANIMLGVSAFRTVTKNKDDESLIFGNQNLGFFFGLGYDI